MYEPLDRVLYRDMNRVIIQGKEEFVQTATALVSTDRNVGSSIAEVLQEIHVL